MVLFLIVHYIACVDFYAPLLIMRLTHGQVARDTFLLKRLGKIEPDLKTFLRWYSISCHYSTSYLLCLAFYQCPFKFLPISFTAIDLNFNFNWPVMAYINVIVFCIFGKIIMAVVTGGYDLCVSVTLWEFGCSYTCQSLSSSQKCGNEVLWDDESNRCIHGSS